MKHWARNLIGQPWTPERPCWWLVRTAIALDQGVDMPALQIGVASPENARAIKKSARVSGLRRMPEGAAPAEGWIVLMRSVIELHAGYVCKANGRLGVLHSSRETGAVWQCWRDAIAGRRVELWGRPNAT